MTRPAQNPEAIAAPAPCVHLNSTVTHATTTRTCTDCGEVRFRATAMLCIPFDAMPEGHHEAIILRLHTELTAPQRVALRGLLKGLTDAKARTADGRLVELPQHAVAWLLENLEFIGE